MTSVTDHSMGADSRWRMRARLVYIVYLAAIGAAMAGWIWAVVACLAWAIT
jgi:hypothetical protein